MRNDDSPTIAEVLTMQPGLLRIDLNVRVLRRPDKVNNFMNIEVGDDHGGRVQCCLFADTCAKYKDLIRTNQCYTIHHPTLQANNRTSNLELKITKESKIIPRESIPE